jgi:hypothetical protein
MHIPSCDNSIAAVLHGTINRKKRTKISGDMSIRTCPEFRKCHVLHIWLRIWRHNLYIILFYNEITVPKYIKNGFNYYILHFMIRLAFLNDENRPMRPCCVCVGICGSRRRVLEQRTSFFTKDLSHYSSPEQHIFWFSITINNIVSARNFELKATLPSIDIGL